MARRYQLDLGASRPERHSVGVCVGVCLRLFAALAMVFAVWTAEAGAEIRVNNDGYAINGFDPVAYFTAGRPIKGRRTLTATYKGAKYAFTTPENRARFLKNPAKYEPQYGGYCAFGVAYGSKSDIDPEVWEIVDGKLYLLINPGTMSIWKKKKRSYIRTADKAWKSILQPNK